MKYLLSILLIGAIGLSLGQDDQCKNDFKNFIQCMKDAKSSVDKDQVKKDLETKANQCFAQSKCSPPNYNESFGGKGFGGRGKDQMPDAVKQCLKKKLLAKVGSKLNDCLSNHGVKNVNFTDLADGIDGTEFGGDGGKEGLEGMAKHLFGVVKGIDKCCVDNYNKDPSKMKPLEQCLHDVKAAAKPKVCEKIKPCKDKASATCQQRGTEIVKALCLCKKEKEKEISGKLRQLGQSKDKVGLQDLVKAVADDQDIASIGDQIEQCYQENNVPEPPLLKVALAALGKGGAGGGLAAKMQVEGRQCIIMADLLEIDANDSKQCDACH